MPSTSLDLFGKLGGSFQSLPTDMMVILKEGGSTRPASTKLCCTLGPASRDVITISRLLEGGMKMARLDFTWGTPEYHQTTLDNLRTAMDMTETPCAVVMEPAGSKIFVINRPQEAIQLQQGQVVTLTCDKTAAASSKLLPLGTLTTFAGHVAPGCSIFVGPYLVTGSETTSAYLTVQTVDGITCTCTCNTSCTLAEGVQLMVNVSDLNISGNGLCAEDVHVITTWGKQNQVDFVSMPQTRSAQDVEDCKALLQSCGMEATKVIAKISCEEGIRAHEEIIEAADAVVFARGHIGTYLAPEKVFLAQKLLLRACNVAGKPVYVTRVVDTMADAPRPTRAEATDVANLVLDGADGILLGAETFKGMYPEQTVNTVSAICRQAEECFSAQAFYQMHMELLNCYTLLPNMNKTEALISSAVRAADKTRAQLIIAFTVTGNTARMLSKYKPQQPILTVVCPDASTAQYSEAKLSPAKATLARSSSMATFKQHGLGNTVMRQCMSYRGVIPIMADPDLHTSVELLEYAINYAKTTGLVKAGDRVVVSKCPRKSYNDVLDEAGVVILVQVEA